MQFIHINTSIRLIAYVLLFLGIGCAASVSRQANKTLLDFLEDGKTTKEMVILKLGAPSGTFEGERIISYRLGRTREGYFVLDQIAEARVQKDPALYSGIISTFSLVLIFDESNILQKHSAVQIQ